MARGNAGSRRSGSSCGGRDANVAGKDRIVNEAGAYAFRNATEEATNASRFGVSPVRA
jgi:hypothetical protein